MFDDNYCLCLQNYKNIVTFVKVLKLKIMSDKKISFRDEIKLNTQKTKEEQASKDFKRNSIGL